MKKKVLITVGGTGGHLFPAQALAKQLLERRSDIDLLFAGGGLSKNRFFDRHTFPFEEVSSASPNFRSPLKLITGGFHIGMGVLQSRKILKKFDPDLVVGFGSYHTFPTLLAAQWASVPIVLHEANSYPGKVNRFFSKRVEVACIHFPETKRWLKGNTKEVELPLRDGYRPDAARRAEAFKYFGLNPSQLTILAFGGSQGAKAINRLFTETMVRHLSRESIDIQVIHLTGDAALSTEIRQLYEDNGLKACVKEFESKMDLAWQAADLMISRSGAMTIAEQMQMEVPGILIPYPYAMDNHQEYNADFIVEDVGGALKVAEAGLTAPKLAQLISYLVADDRKNLKKMRESIHKYKINFKRPDLYSVVSELIGNS